MSLDLIIHELAYAAAGFSGVDILSILGKPRQVEVVESRRAIWYTLVNEHAYPNAHIRRAWPGGLGKGSVRDGLLKLQDRLDQGHKPTIQLVHRLAEVINDLESEYMGPPGTIAPPSQEVFIVVNA